MNSIQMNNNTMINGNQVWINGIPLPPAPCKGNNVTSINGKIYIDGYEFKKGKWRHTIRALWHLWF